MKDCSSCKYSPLNNSKLAGKALEKTPCFVCVMEDQIKNKKGGAFIESCGNVEFNEMLHVHISTVAENLFSRVVVRLVSLVASGEFDSDDCRIMEMMFAYPKPSFRDVTARLKIPVETVHRRWDRIMRLLSKE